MYHGYSFGEIHVGKLDYPIGDQRVGGLKSRTSMGLHPDSSKGSNLKSLGNADVVIGRSSADLQNVDGDHQGTLVLASGQNLE